MAQEEQWEEINPMETPVWQPKKVGDELMGVLEHVDENVGPNKSHMYTLRKPNGDLVKIWGSTLLDSRFQFINLGEHVKIIFQGEKKGVKSGRDYLDFKVYHRAAPLASNPTQPTKKSEEISPDDIPF